MKRFIPNLTLFAIATVVALFIGSTALAQEAEVVVDSLSMAAEGAEGVSSSGGGSDILYDIIAVLVVLASLAGTLFVIGHMIFIRFWRSPRYKKSYDAEYFRAQRAEKGLSTSSTTDENNMAISLLSHATDSWVSSKDSESGDEMLTPTKKRHLRETVEIIDGVLELAPTDQRVITSLNEIINVVNVNETRHFDGSKPMIWIALILGVIFFFAAEKSIGAFIPMALGAGIYYVASCRPTFLLAKEQGGKIGCLNGLLIGVLGFIGMARTVRTVTTYSDGSRRTSDDHSQHLIFLIIGCMVILFLAGTIVIWSFVNYLRNYVFYI